MRRSYPRYLCKVPRTTTAHRQRASRDAHTSMALQGHLCSCPGRSSSFIRLIPLSRGPNGEGLQPRTPRGVPEVAAGLVLIPTYAEPRGRSCRWDPFGVHQLQEPPPQNHHRVGPGDRAWLTHYWGRRGLFASFYPQGRVETGRNLRVDPQISVTVPGTPRVLH